ncbi:hypothetical protein TWF694_006760 [Orbilia ellipsospora]|uniref:Uncharacterized protein n=1 Tax=Orbilia ellipsospora TaxID=2528407 RepID=A0AAV9XNQ5_9PEZI
MSDPPYIFCHAMLVHIIFFFKLLDRFDRCARLNGTGNPLLPCLPCHARLQLVYKTIMNVDRLERSREWKGYPVKAAGECELRYSVLPEHSRWRSGAREK